jgi:hypothetical protein
LFDFESFKCIIVVFRFQHLVTFVVSALSD